MNRIKLSKGALAVLGFAAALFLSCTDIPDLKFPSYEEVLQKASSSSIAEQPYSSSVEAAVSSSFDGSSSSEEPSSSSSEKSSSSESEVESSSSGEVPTSSSSEEPSSSSETRGEFIDVRDSTKYKWVEIGEQVWMAENVNYYNNGQVKCINIEDDCTKYGGLYNWYYASSVCPAGWHLPDKDEWGELINFVGSAQQLKDKADWGEDGTMDDYGFTALCGGYCNSSCNQTNGIWWTATYSGTNGNSSIANRVRMEKNNNNIFADTGNKNDYYSVRCIKD